MFCILCKERTKSLKIPFRMTIFLKSTSQEPLRTAIRNAKKLISKKREKMQIFKRYNIQFISPPKNKNITK